MRAVLRDMDGTLVDSEKLWDIAMHALYARMGGVLSAEVRESTVGGSSETVMRIVYDDLGLELDPAAMADSADWLHDYTGELFEQVFCRGVRVPRRCSTVSPQPGFRWRWRPTPAGTSPSGH